jgi:hypothetical protein
MMPIVIVTSADEIFDGDLPVNAWLRKPIAPPSIEPGHSRRARAAAKLLKGHA